MKTKVVGIYKITNPKGNIYIGQSSDIQKRFKEYKRLNCKNQTKIFNSLNKYGYENHIFEIICIVKDHNLLNNYEIFYINYYRKLGIELLNLREGGANGKMSLESCLKSSKSHIGQKAWNKGLKNTFKHTEEYKKQQSERLSNGNHPMSGKTFSELVKKNMSNSKIRKPNMNSMKVILRFNKENEKIKEYSSLTEASLENKILISSISNCLSGKSNTAGGYKWMYKL